MDELTGENTLIRIFIGESDHHDGTPLYMAIVEMLRCEGIAGATVLRGIAGYGARSVLHTANVLRLSTDLPLIIEAVDTAEKVEMIIPKLDQIIGDGLITLEKVRVIRHSPRLM